ncbi:MAG: hypothetical protein ACXVCG_10885 [Bdellovibrionota bacterium]
MKNLIVLAVATLFATTASAAEMKWNGSAGWRYSQTKNDDGLGSLDNVTNGKDVSTTRFKAHQIRANFGAAGGWEHVEYGFGIRTGQATNDDYVTVNQNADRAIGLDQAWFRYVRDFGSLDLAATIGRQKNAMIYDQNWETLFDNDVRWDGFGWNFKFGMFGFNAAQYVLGSVTHAATNGAIAGQPTSSTANASSFSVTDSSESSATGTKHFQMLYAFQPHMNWKFSDEIEAMFSVAYYRWVYEGAANQTGGGVGAQNNGAGNTIPPIASSAFKMDNRSQWDFLANVTLPYNLAFTGDLVKSNAAAYDNQSISGYNGLSTTVSSTAWTLGLTYGKLRKAQDFTIGYAYGTKGIGSVINTFTNDKFLADNKGHTVVVGYSMADNFNLGFKWMNLQEKERVSTQGTATTGALAGNAYGPSAAGVAGVNANQKMKTNYWELTAGVAF